VRSLRQITRADRVKNQSANDAWSGALLRPRRSRSDLRHIFRLPDSRVVLVANRLVLGADLLRALNDPAVLPNDPAGLAAPP
jgi:hypothetical protein